MNSAQRPSGYSTSPEGTRFPLPLASEYETELERLEERAKAARAEGKEVVVVMGVGFVGAVMARVVADTTDKSGNSTKFVIGCQRPSERYFELGCEVKGLGRGHIQSIKKTVANGASSLR